MPSPSVADSTFFWESWSNFDRLKRRLIYEPPPLKKLKESLKQLSLSETLKSEKATPLNQAVAYLADNSDPKVEKIVEQKLSQATPAELKVALSHLVSFSIHHDRKQMLDVCQRVVQLDALKKAFEINDIQPIVQGWARHFPKKGSRIQDSGSHRWQFPFPDLSKLRYFRYYIINLVGLAYGIDFTERPTGKWAAQYQLSFFRSTFSDIQYIGTQYLKYFSSTRKAVLVAVALFAAFTATFLLYSRITSRTATTNNSKPPPSLDKQLFIDLTEKAREGLISPSFGIEEGMRLVETCLSSSDKTPPMIVLLLGPPGSGKTRYIEELARRIAKKETACLNGKRVYIVNTADMGEKGSWSDSGSYVSRMDKIFESLEGFEGEVIVCFDEAHMFDKKTANQLKTKLMQRKIRAIFATTPFEFGNSFLDQEPVITRGQIVIVGSLDREHTRQALLGFLSANQDIHATPKAIDELLNISVTLTGAEPRKSLKLLSYLINVTRASGSQPHAVLSYLMGKYDKKKEAFKDQLNSMPLYDCTDEGKEEQRKLDLLLDSIQQLNQHHLQRLDLLTSIKTLLEIQSNYREKQSSLTEELASSKNLSKEKEYLFLRFVTLSILKGRIETLISKLNEMQPTKELQTCLENQVLDQAEYKKYSQLQYERAYFTIDEDLITAKKFELEENYRINMQNSSALKKHYRPRAPLDIQRSLSTSPYDDPGTASATPATPSPSVPQKSPAPSPPSSDDIEKPPSPTPISPAPSPASNKPNAQPKTSRPAHPIQKKMS